jgi:hypothetical protein
MSKNCLELTLDNILSICFLYENRMVRFFQRTPKSIFLIQSCSYTLLILFLQSPKALCLIKSTMSDHDEERWVKARHDVTQFYKRRGVKRTTSRQDLPRGDMTISGDSNPSANISSEDDGVEDDTYMSSHWARPHGKRLASASSSGATRDEEEIEEEEDGENGNDGTEGDDDEEDEEVFDVEEINPTFYIHMGTLVFRLPLNPDWREKISYKGKTDLVREKRKENPRLVEKEPDIDYRFHTVFQQDFYESVIITKIKPTTNSQWIDWTYIEAKHDTIFDEVVAACRAKHLRDVMSC